MAEELSRRVQSFEVKYQFKNQNKLLYINLLHVPGGYRATETSDVSMWPSQLIMYI